MNSTQKIALLALLAFLIFSAALYQRVVLPVGTDPDEKPASLGPAKASGEFVLEMDSRGKGDDPGRPSPARAAEDRVILGTVLPADTAPESFQTD